MVYIYKENDEIKYTRGERPQVEEIIELERMIPIPQKEGYLSILNANFETNQVWYDLIETEEHIKQTEIAELKQQLADTDYKAIKYAEGQITEEEYSETKEQRQAWRDRINELESEV